MSIEIRIPPEYNEKIHVEKMMMLVMGVFTCAGIAQAAEYPCIGCNPAQMAAKARQVGIGTHYIYDTYAGTVQKFEVTRERAGNGTYTWWVNPVEVEPDVQEMVIDIAAFRSATNGTMSANLTLTAPPEMGTAWDSLQPGGARTRMLDWVDSFSAVSFSNVVPMEGITLQAFGTAAVNIFKSQQFQTTYTVTFADGSRISLTFNVWTNSSTIVEGSAMDAAGNPIPLKPDDVVNIRFDFTHDPNGTAQARMEAWLVQLGIQLSATGTHNRIITCVGTPGGKFECKVI